MKQIASFFILLSLAGALSCNRNDLYKNTENENEALLMSNLDMGLTVSIQSPVSGSTNAPIPITIVFKSPVTGFDLADIVVGNGSAGGFAGSGDTYTATITPLVDGAVTVDIPAGSAQDAEGNLSKAAPRFTVVYDTVVGLSTVIIGSNNPNTSLAVLGDRVTLSFTAGEALITPTVEINTVAATVSGGPVNWTASRVMNAGDPEVAVTFTISGIQDLAGNVAADVSATTDASTVVYDMTAPTIDPVSIISSNPLSAMAIVGDTVTLTFVSDEDLQAPAVTINGAAAAVAGGPVNWTATRVMAAGDPEGVVAFSIGSIRDLAGNATAAIASTTDLTSVTLDRTAPRITSIDSFTADGAYGTGANIDVTVNFDENVTLAGNDLELTLDTGAVVHIAPFGPSMSASGTYIVGAGESSGDLNVTNVALAGAATMTDAPGNSASLALPGGSNLENNRAIVIDTAAPFITSITSATANGTYGTGATIDVTVNFSENVTLAGNDLLVTLDTGVVVSIAPFGPAGSASGTYTVAAGNTSALLNVTNVALAVGATLRDVINNDASLGLPGGNNLADNKAIAIDTAVPFIVSITSTPAAGTHGTGATIDVTVNFSDNLTLAGNTMTLTLDTGGTVSIAPFGPSSNGMGTYTVAANETSALLNVTNVALEAGATLRDGLNNDANLTLPVGNNLADNSAVAIDAVAPTVTGVTSATADGPHGTGANIDVTVNFDKNVTLTVGTLEVTLDTGDTVSIAAFGPAMTASGTYIVGAGDTSADLNSTGLSLAGGGILRDDYGNNADLTIPVGQSLADNKALEVDTTAPFITSITSSTADGRYRQGASIDVTVNFSEDVTLTVGTLDILLDTGAAVNIAAFGPSNTASGTYIVGAGENSTDLNVNTLALGGGGILRDAAGNNTDLTPPVGGNLADTRDIAIDTVTPFITAAETMDADGNGRIDHYRVTLSEDVNDSSFPGHAANSQGSLQFEWTAAGYPNLVMAQGSAAPEADTANDDVIYLKFSESLVHDTDAKPDLTTGASPALSDLAGNIIAQVNMAAVVETDTAAPVVVNVVGPPGGNTAMVAFSEAVDRDGGICDGASNLAFGDFDYFNTSGGGATSLTGMSDGDACDGQAEVLADAVFAPADMETDAIGPRAAQIFDAANNPALTSAGTIHGFLSKMVCRFDTTPDGADVPNDVMNFPLLLRLTDPAIIDAVQPDADDIRFIDKSGIPLKYHVERWDQALDRAEVWVLVPQVDGNSTGDYITMYYDDVMPGTVPDGQDPAGVFDVANGFAGVWHLADGVAPATIDDVTVNGNDGANVGSVNDLAGIIGLARSFDGAAAHILQATSPSLNITGQLTLSAWVRPDNGEFATDYRIISKKAVADGYELVINTQDETIKLLAGGPDTALADMSASGDVLDTGWHYMGATINGTTAELFLDGLVAPSDGTVDALQAGGTDLVFGASPTPAYFFDGAIDEIRVEHLQRSPEWIKLCYENQRLAQRLIKFWFDPAWQYRKRITVRSAKVADDLLSFPVYLRLDDLGADFFNRVKPDGSDIVITAGNGRMKLPREVAAIDTGMQRGELWFNAPALLMGQDVSFYVYYGNATATEANDPAVWSNNYAGVWHLTDNVDPKESSPNSQNGSFQGAPAAVAGQMGGAILFDGVDDYVEIISSASLEIGGDVTVSAWFKPALGTDLEMALVSKRSNAAAVNGYEITANPLLGDLTVYSNGGSFGEADMAPGTITTAWFNYYVAVYHLGMPMGTCSLYFNGADMTTDPDLALLTDDNTPLRIGSRFDDTLLFNGVIDEVRVSSVERTAGWVETEYNNQSDPFTFFNYGAEEEVDSP